MAEDAYLPSPSEEALAYAHLEELQARTLNAHLTHAWDAGREQGIRDAVRWLRADYEYGTGPDWREHGAQWIEDRVAEERVLRATAKVAGGGCPLSHSDRGASWSDPCPACGWPEARADAKPEDQP